MKWTTEVTFDLPIELVWHYINQQISSLRLTPRIRVDGSHLSLIPQKSFILAKHPLELSNYSDIVLIPTSDNSTSCKLTFQLTHLIIFLTVFVGIFIVFLATFLSIIQEASWFSAFLSLGPTLLLMIGAMTLLILGVKWTIELWLKKIADQIKNLVP